MIPDLTSVDLTRNCSQLAGLSLAAFSYSPRKGLVWVTVLFALAISTLARALRAMCESDNKPPFSRQQGFPGRAPQVGHATPCALSFIAVV